MSDLESGVRGMRLAGFQQIVDVVYVDDDGFEQPLVRRGQSVHLHPSGLWVVFRDPGSSTWRMQRIPSLALEVYVKAEE